MGIPRFVRLGYVSALVLLMGACGSSGGGDQYTVRLEAAQSVDAPGARAKVILFGANVNIADGPATIIDTVVVTVDGLPADITMTWPRDAHTLISGPPVGGAQDARFYLSIAVDIDNDGMVCRGDYVQDFDRTPFFSFTNAPSSTTTIFVTEQDNDFCRALAASGSVLL